VTDRKPAPQDFAKDVIREHGQRLRSFLQSRLRYAPQEVPDLMQEVYLRLLRVPPSTSVRSPQAYLFTIAFHVLHQHKLLQAAAPETMDPAELTRELDELRSKFTEAEPVADLQIAERLAQLAAVLAELPPRCQAAFVLHRAHGYTLQEIAAQLGVSRDMVKKYLARALAHCRERLGGLAGGQT
jgi:RNA polymerase sigma factor (sigma-70 family)